jgi:hypothetical protein
MTLTELSVAFTAYVAIVAGAVLGTTWRWLPAPLSRRLSLGLLAWLAYAGGVSASGLLRDPTLRPPGILLLALPALAFAVFSIGRGRLGSNLAAALPVWLLTGLQAFRVGVELTLQALFEAGQVPRLMTLAGGNVELLIALTAPLAAWLSTRGRRAQRVAEAWNLLGLLSLLNVVARGVMSAPGPLHVLPTEVPNVAIGSLPYSYIPGLMVPLALILHLLAFRAIRMAKRS